ncbi:MAG: hypothetical protein HC844_06090 [Tabrizicola sp.]|nr:hypothetical protein [Tabrizicola sp.]
MLIVAVAAGHLVETVKRDRVQARAVTGLPEAVVDVSGSKAALPSVLPRSASLSPVAPIEGPRLSADTVIKVLGDPVASATGLVDHQRCPASLLLLPEPDAMIAVTLNAPCSRNQRVVLRHAGLTFAARTSDDGTLTVRLPALQTEALVSVFFPDAEVALANVIVPDADSVRRIVVQWNSADFFDLRVSEGARVFTARDHLQADRGVSLLMLGDGTVDQPLFAEVYTYPAAADAAVDIQLEVAISEATCGRDLRAERIFFADGVLKIDDLNVAVPACGTADTILVLKNFVPDLNIAAAN